MCGISGVVGSKSANMQHIVDRMNFELAHRGPDGEGHEQLGFARFGHRRLSVIDISEASSQPFICPSRAYMVTFNGEIYNYRELRQELIRLGHQFRSKGDTEVLLNAYIQWGPMCLEKFNGMFAFGIWDYNKKTLFLARDRMGEKPLYYCRLNDHIVFASEPRAISPFLTKRAGNIKSLVEYLYLNYNVGENCLLDGIKKLRPASFMLIKFDGAGIASDVSVRQYWSHSSAFHNKISVPERDAKHQLLELLERSVKLRMRSDRQIGCLLSGGLDSSSVLAMMTKADPAAVPASFTTKFPHPGYDESKFAAEVADYLGSIHSVDLLDNLSFDGLIHAARQCASEPFADGSFLAMTRLCGFAAHKITVALTGDGADELFAGYQTVIADKYAEKLSFGGARASQILQLISNFLPVDSTKVPLSYRLSKFATNFTLPRAPRHQAWRSIFSFDEIRQVLRSEFASSFSESEIVNDFLPLNAEDHGLDLIDLGLLLDQKTWLPDNVLLKSDRAGMANGIELRAPFLDHELVEYAASLPSRLKSHGGQQKHILKAALKGHLPKRPLMRKKEGYSSPIALWLHGRLGDSVVSSICESTLSEVLNPESVQQLLTQHRRFHADNSYRIFGLFVLSQTKIKKWV